MAKQPTQAKAAVRSIALITSEAYSLSNFRGPLMRELVRRGLTVYALAPDFGDETRSAAIATGAVPVDISLSRTGLHPLRDLADIVRLWATLRRLGPDAVLGYFIKPVIYGSIAATAAGVRHRFALIAGLGYTFGNDPEQGAGALVRRAVRLLYRLAFSLCEVVFLQNEEDLAELSDAGLLDRGKAVRLTGTGVELDRLMPAAPVTSPMTFLLMARLLKQKGIREFASAAQLVKRARPGTRFILLGDVDSNPNSITRQEVERWVAEGTIEWPGQVSNVLPYIAASSVYVLPSYYREGIPRSSQEAMAMGRPVITTDNIGCRETVVDGISGFLVPVRDVSALAEAMMRFIEQPELVELMGRESRLLAERQFDVHRINATMLDEMRIFVLKEVE